MSVFTQLAACSREEPLALLAGVPGAEGWLLRDPLEVLAIEAGDEAFAFQRLDAFLARHCTRRCAGYLGYDLREAVEPLPRKIVDDLGLPVLHVVAYGTGEKVTLSETPPPAQGRAGPIRPHLARRAFEARIAQVVEHVRAGDIFQANLTQPFSGPCDIDTRALFASLCASSPAPFSAYLELGDGRAVLSASPEEFLRRDGDRVETRPIKGTRPRGASPAADRALLAELLASEKDRAELAMIIDLMRNDLGKVARTGTVRVGPFPEHASFAQVHHTFACVRAQLRAGVTAGELLTATFPPGSVTGAPKLRAMEIIEDLEVVRRGVYTGAIGWFGPGDALHLNVAIRTMVAVDGRVRFNTGGGITAESEPAAEYDETLHKAAGLLRALGAELELP